MMTNPLSMRRTEKTKKPLLKRIYEYRRMYLMLLPAIAAMILFHYGPMYGIQIAFKNYKPRLGIIDSPWVGFKYFERMFREASFMEVFINTLTISGLKLVFCFPAGVLYALLLNEIRRVRMKKAAQTISYLPHFISWVVAGGLISSMFSLHGPVNALIKALGGKPEIWLSKQGPFLVIVLLSDIWKNMGWGSIIYLAAIAGIPGEQYEAADIDGATRLQQARYITLPSILPVVLTMVILRVGGIMNAGFDQIFNLYSPIVYDVADIIDTFSYRVGLIDRNFSYSTAIGLFKNVLGFILMLSVNQLTKLSRKNSV